MEKDFVYHHSQFIGSRYDDIGSVPVHLEYHELVQFFIYKNAITNKRGLVIRFDNEFVSTAPLADSIILGKPDSYKNFEYYFSDSILITDCINVIFYNNGSASLWQVKTESYSCRIIQVGEILTNDFFIPIYSYEYDDNGYVDHISANYQEVNSDKQLSSEEFDKMIVSFEIGGLVSEQTEEGEIRYTFSSPIAYSKDDELDFGSFVRIWYYYDSSGSLRVANYKLIQK
ncbi:MAG: hypothetical protein JNJ99_06410 [Crocinitomicaceae bacterium]|nr:hypothetical protein [Crocinitomicaceae bacterium]